MSDTARRVGGAAVSDTAPRRVLLADLTWQEADRLAPGTLLAVPLGATEQHGPHLPLGTDSRIARAMALELAARRPDVVVAPTVPFGSSGEHAGFAGTLSIGRHALESLVVELVRSADGFGGVVLVSAHGGNAEALRRAVRTLTDEGRQVIAWWPRSSAVEGVDHSVAPDAHAGWVETSLLLALAPDLVRGDLAEAGDRRPLAEVAGALFQAGVASVSANGVLGDPAGASAQTGRILVDRLVADLGSAVDERFGHREAHGA